MVTSKSLGSKATAIEGLQRQAIIRTLVRPRTGSHILREAKRIAPKLSYADMRRILRDFEKDKLVFCINPENQTGRVYSLTPKGVAIAERQFESFSFRRVQAKIDWATYGAVARSKSLASVLDAFRISLYGHDRRTPTQVRKSIIPSVPISMSSLIGAIRRLEHLNLVSRKSNTTKDSRLEFYSITPKGRIVAEQLFD